MQNYIPLTICLCIICLLLINGRFSNSEQVTKNQNYYNNSDIHDYNAIEPPFIIHYGLNDSHSRSWVQINDNGIIGIIYFQRFESSSDEGTLIYKTILPDGTENEYPITDGRRLEKAVLLYDSLARPHIFVASSSSTDQVIDHYFNNNNNQWQNETIIHFYNTGGKFIYEISADIGPDASFHLLILKTRSDVDSDDFLNAWMDSHLYYLTNSTGNWENELIFNYDMAYTYDMCIKSSIRQDIKVDNEGYVHVTFSEQINGSYDPSRLYYATNKTGTWKREIVLSYDPGTVDDAGWFPSLCLDNNDIPYIACNYLKRVPTHSVTSCRLLLLKRLEYNEWSSELVAAHDDGYYGTDGRNYTGALCHLVFDSNNRPNLVFSDIASTHWDFQRMNVGNIRYAILSEGQWKMTTVYRQPLPTDFFSATEIHGMCLIISEETDTLRVIGQELVITGRNEYSRSLINFALNNNSPVADNSIKHFELRQNFPNPFNPTTTISWQLPEGSNVTLKIFNTVGEEITTLVNEEKPAGEYKVNFNAKALPSGIYFYRIQASSFIETKKMILLK